MSSSRIIEDFNCDHDLGIPEFTANIVRNEITLDMFKIVVEKSN